MMNINDKYIKYFYEINKIPRKSGYEKEISEYIIEFAKSHNLKFYTDEVYKIKIELNGKEVGYLYHIQWAG